MLVSIDTTFSRYAPVTSDIAHKNFQRWNIALHSKDPSQMLNIYQESATLLPTLASDYRTNPSSIHKYFEHFLKKNPIGYIIEEKIQPIDDNNYIHSGLYNFNITKNHKQEEVSARFTFVWQRSKNGPWKILHHHSSLRPQD